jgi:hypothetical protein
MYRVSLYGYRLCVFLLLPCLARSSAAKNMPGSVLLDTPRDKCIITTMRCLVKLWHVILVGGHNISHCVNKKVHIRHPHNPPSLRKKGNLQVVPLLTPIDKLMLAPFSSTSRSRHIHQDITIKAIEDVPSMDFFSGACIGRGAGRLPELTTADWVVVGGYRAGYSTCEMFGVSLYARKRERIRGGA